MLEQLLNSIIMKSTKFLIKLFHFFLGFVFLSAFDVQAQFQGGDGDGYGKESYLGLLNGTSLESMFQGGNGDGFSQCRTTGLMNGLSANGHVKGGDGDGYGTHDFLGLLNGVSTQIMFSGGSGDGFDHNRTSSFLQGITFPIALLSFDAFPENDHVVIQWITESELNNDFFTVERSQNAQEFYQLLEVDGAGTTTEVQTYEELDWQPFQGRSYYRLKSTDYDGTFYYSPIVEVNREIELIQDMIVFPNPNSGEDLNLRLTGLEGETEFLIEMTDIEGRTIFRKSYPVIPTEGMSEIKLQQRITSGVYLISMTTDGNQISKRVVIK